MNKIIKKIWMSLAILIILMAVLSSVFRSLTPWAKQYKGEVEQHLSILLGQPVTIQTMETGWYWFQPVLKLKQVTLGSDSRKSFHLNKLLVGINVFRSIWNWQIQPGVLYIDDMHLTLREKGDHWTIDGISTDTLNSEEITPEKTKQILVWLSQQERLTIKRVSMSFHFSDGGLIPVDGLNVSVSNNGGHYKFKGSARLEQTNSTDFELLGDGYFDPDNFDEIEGKFYFSAQNIMPAQWQSLFPNATEHLEGGKGGLQVWMDVHKGSVASVQAQVKLEHLAWRLLNKEKSQLVQSFFANLSWQPDNQGWQLHGDHIQLRVGGLNWPENQLLVKYNQEQQTYQFFIKNIIIESLLSDAINWPKSIQNLLQIKPQGILHDTQVLVRLADASFRIPLIPQLSSASAAQEPVKTWAQGNEITYVLTRFEQLGWNGNPKKKILEVRNLSGVVNWQPEEGRLELDSENTLVAVHGYPAQNLTLLNGAVDWKELNDGLRISIDRFVLSTPELTLSAQGALDQVSRKSVGAVRLNAEFSGKNIEQWAPFLPKKHMKAKLYTWLTRDLKHIAEMSGTISLNGVAQDFPFDDHNGEFTIKSHASGGELYINPKWKIIKDIEGDIQLTNRNLNIAILNADFQGVPVNQMNLRIDNIGNNKENLIVTGSINAPVQKMVNYVMSSPLKTKLALLKQLAIDGYAQLNLNLEVPLYPENDKVLAKGDLTFKDNVITVKYDLVKFMLKGVTGELFFTDDGVSDSSLIANSMGHPLNIKIQSVKTPKSATSIVVEGTWTVDSLKTRHNAPILALLNGSFPVKAILKLANKSSEADTIKLTSSLQGLAVNLPAPLGKAHNDTLPLDVNVDLNADKSIRLKSNYDARLSTDLLFKMTNGALDLDSGQIRLGNAKALNQKLPGLALVGSLTGFELDEWKTVYNQYTATQNTGPSLLNKLRIINVTLDKFSILKQQFDALTVKAKLLPNKDWSFSLNQKNIAADLLYRVSANELSGHIQRLHLEKFHTKGIKSSESSEKIHPNQIPNLDLRVDNLSVGAVHIGDVTLKSQSTVKRWSLNYCRIDSPVYQFNIDGAWTQTKKADQSAFHLKLEMSNVAKSLERWGVNPSVRAKKGYLEFKGGWNSDLAGFSLAKLNGDMFLQLKNGRITDLSKSTEGKLDLGKLLSILSLQTIPRRLQLDFSDLASQGYSFDIFQGNFSIRKGRMTTQDSYIDGPVAYASMKGDLDLVRQTYDMNLKISPHITASLPIVATIAGGPVAGVATWVATKIINQGMQKISAYSYKISGPWKQPVVQQLTIVRKKNNPISTGQGPLKDQLNLD
ncbi:YhdP family protein [Legionella sp.]|uniref:YhdP family protein n=1 Tax=Legionella sp. TaxID=459 RepID=UPI003D0B9AFC